MAKKRLVIEIEFDEEVEDDYTNLEFSRMAVVEPQSDVTRQERDSLAESWAQSDWYWVGFCNSLIAVLGGDEVHAKDVRSY